MALLDSFQRTVTTAGTEVALKTTTFKVRNFAIKALHANTGFIYVGRNGVTSSTGYPLDAGESVAAAAIMTRGSDGSYDLSQIYIDSSVNGEGVAVFFNFEEDEDPTA